MTQLAIVDGTTNVVLNVAVAGDPSWQSPPGTYTVPSDTATIGDVFDTLTQTFSPAPDPNVVPELDTSLEAIDATMTDALPVIDAIANNPPGDIVGLQQAVAQLAVFTGKMVRYEQALLQNLGVPTAINPSPSPPVTTTPPVA